MSLRTLAAPAVLSLSFLLFPGTAEAKKLPIVLWGQGEDIYPIKEKAQGEMHFGYMYSYFAIFFMNAWTWDGKFVLYSTEGETKQFVPLPSQDPKQVATLLGVDESVIKVPLRYRFPVLLVGVSAVIVLIVLKKLRGGASPPKGGAAA
jgi:hypothetical protein